MKRIIFYFTHNPKTQWNPYTIKNIGLGGNYVATWNLAREFAKDIDIDVTVFTSVHKDREDVYERVKFIDASRIPQLINNSAFSELPLDLFISCESGVPTGIHGTTNINWIHRNIEDAVNDSYFDNQVFASEFHKQYLGATSGEIIPNGVDIELFKQHFPKIENDITFVGHPIKGMQYIVKVMEKVRETIKPVTTHVYGDAEIWGWDQQQFTPIQTELIKGGIKYHGKMGQEVLARLLHQSKIFLYPTTFQEPFGMAVLEAMAGGCVPIVSESGNLPELVKDCGFVIEGLPTTVGWSAYAAEKIVQLLTDKEMFEEYSERCVTKAQEFSWDKIANIWKDKFLSY